MRARMHACVGVGAFVYTGMYTMQTQVFLYQGSAWVYVDVCVFVYVHVNVPVQ